VVVADISDDKGKAVADSIDGAFAHMDVTSTDDIIAATELAKTLGPVRALVNCAGTGWAARTVGRGGYDTAHDLSAFRRILEINTIGTFDCIRIVATAMAETEPLADGERGAIVNTASIAAFDGQVGQIAYSASKGGVVGLTLPAARDLSQYGIRVNTIAPGLFDTPMLAHLREDIREGLASGVPHPRRLGNPDEYALLAVQALENPYLNGQTIRLDGAIRMPPR
jgi:NAD(P)-dependent dehydrogenase (short-subunit alcohol dehydrogenase family)